MAFRTYVPQLRVLITVLHRFMTHWQSKLQGNMTEAQYACMLDLIQASASCLAALGEQPVDP